MTNKARLAATCATVLSLMVAACNHQPGGGYLSTHSADPNDVCGAAHAELFNSRGYFERSITEGMLAGALIGALGGLAVGGARGKHAGQSALIGAGAGALLGGMGGYFQAKQQQSQDRDALATSIDKDLDNETAEIQRATVAIKKVSECRRGAALRIKADYKAGRMTVAEANTKLAQQKALFDAEMTEAEAIGTKIQSRRDEYNFAAEQVLSQDSDAKSAFEAHKAREEAMARAAEEERLRKLKTGGKTGKTARVEPANLPSPPANATTAKTLEVAVDNDNLNKRAGEYHGAIAEAKNVGTSGTFDLAG
ncbi:MAG: hypothetical protein HY985_12960 [Magnetospirillum sp.]|nr:hypothetical protein [Magnetospirillum sp.]